MHGCRFSIYPMTDNFVDVILGALSEVSKDGLEVVTDDVSTYVEGPEDQMLAYVQGVFTAAARRTQHVVCALLLSRGCPGEEECALDPDAPWPEQHVRSGELQLTGIQAAAHLSLYPLGVPTYMDVIYREIGALKDRGTYKKAEHFASRLEGDIAEVFAGIQDAWDRAEADTRHVVAHATISVGSPSAATPR
jgi:uncharacterized protein YqgV (UPF0045/DUF77 family)